MIKTTIYLIYNMGVSLTNNNVDTINDENDTNYPYGITYQNLYDSRAILGSQRGYFQNKNGDWFVWVLPYIKGGIDLEGTNPNVIVEVTEEDYLTNHLPTYDETTLE